MYVLDVKEDRPQNSAIKVSAEDSLCRCGALEEDINWYQDEYDIFETQALTGENYPPLPFKKSGIVASSSVLLKLISDHTNDELLADGSALEKYFKIIEVRDESSLEEDADSTLAKERRLTPDISVQALGELRALTICSFAVLNKRQ